MRVLVRLLALGLLAAAAVVAATDVGRGPAGSVLSLSPLGKIWFDLDPASLNMLQAGIQRRISPALWEDLIQPVLTWPAAPVFAAAGAALLLASRRRRGHI
ncbi:MAG: hypothetical protein NZ523_10300 [Elioraea sp.]|nr:hypothetical protein [Elioraea sp.]